MARSDRKETSGGGYHAYDCQTTLLFQNPTFFLLKGPILAKLLFWYF